MSLTVDALIVLASIFASAFFSGAETALTAASRARMHALEMDGDPSAKLVNRLIAARGRLISAMLLGGQIVNIAASSFATSVLLVVAGDRGVVYATVIMTVLVVIFAEVLPKTIAIAYPDRVSLADRAGRLLFRDDILAGGRRRRNLRAFAALAMRHAPG